MISGVGESGMISQRGVTLLKGYSAVIDQRLHRFEHASPIGRWSVTVCTPDPRLADVVATMWYGEGHVAYQRDRILPSGQSQLLINLGPPQYRIEPGPPERRVPFVDVWYSGLHQGPIDTEAPHGNALLGVAFSARGTYPWLGPQLEGLADRIIALAGRARRRRARVARASAQHAGHD